MGQQQTFASFETPQTSLTISRIIGPLVLLALFSLPAFGGAFVRVNQVGYPANASKRAYLMASASEAGASFSVKNSSGTVVYTANIGAALGSSASGAAYAS